MRWLLVLALIGCGKKDPGPPCEQVVDHMLEVTKTNLPGHENTNLGGANQKKAMVNACEARKWDSEVRTCLVAAQSIAEIAKCRGGRTDLVERPRRPRIPGGSGSGFVRPGSGSGLPFVHPSMGSGSGSATGSGSAKPASGSAAGSGSATRTGSAGSGSNRGSGSAK